VTTGGLRAERLASLGRLLDTQAAAGGHDTRRRIDRLLDRDSPFLELAPLAAPTPVVGIGLVARTGCVVMADRPDGPSPKAERAQTVAAGCALPLLELRADDDDTAAERLRQRVRHGGGTDCGPAGAVPEPAVAHPDAVLDAAQVTHVLDHVLDASRFEPWIGALDPGTTAGWGAIGGLAVAVLGRDGEGAGDPTAVRPFLEGSRAGAVPLLRVAVTGPAVTLTLSDPGRIDFTFAWPGGDDPGAEEGDGAIDPRDSRTVLAVARWCLERR
jgi:hypothetical protein